MSQSTIPDDARLQHDPDIEVIDFTPHERTGTGEEGRGGEREEGEEGEEGEDHALMRLTQSLPAFPRHRGVSPMMRQYKEGKQVLSLHDRQRRDKEDAARVCETRGMKSKAAKIRKGEAQLFPPQSTRHAIPLPQFHLSKSPNKGTAVRGMTEHRLKKNLYFST